MEIKLTFIHSHEKVVPVRFTTKHFQKISEKVGQHPSQFSSVSLTSVLLLLYYKKYMKPMTYIIAHYVIMLLMEGIKVKINCIIGKKQRWGAGIPLESPQQPLRFPELRTTDLGPILKSRLNLECVVHFTNLLSLYM